MSEFHPIVPDKLLFHSRRLRQDSTFPERRLWHYLRGGQLCGLKFRRQHAIGPFVADFYCHEHQLVIVLDGASQNDQGQYDLDREDYLKSLNLRVVRFSNDDVLKDIDAVLHAILIACGIDSTGGKISDTPSP